MANPPAIGLRVNGKEYGGWKTARITRGIKALSGSFTVTATDKWAAQSKPWAIYEGDECSVVIGKERLITGFVDDRDPSFDATSHSLTLTGRDKTADMVDSSAVLDKWEFTGLTVLAFVRKVAAPFGISVALQAGLTDAHLPKPPKKLAIDPGDTAFGAIENACKLAALLPVSDGNGGLLLTRAGKARCESALVEGQNILGGGAKFSQAGRFARYLVLGQHKGTDGAAGVNASAVKGVAHDAGVRRSGRVLLIRPDGNVTSEHAKARAQWEAITRAARGDSATISVQGWVQGNGQVWPINAFVPVVSQTLGINGDMLITQAAYSIDDNSGTVTELTLERPDAYKPEPIVAAGGNYWKEIVRGV